MNSRDLLNKIVQRFEGHIYSTLTVVERQTADLLIGQGLMTEANDELYITTDVESKLQDPPDYLQDVRDFHVAFEHRISLIPCLGNYDLKNLRFLLLREEFNEFTTAISMSDVVRVADALGDILYVTFGACLAFGIPIADVWKAIQTSNMAKLGPDGKPIYNQIGKVMKPEGWQPPDIASIIVKHSDLGEPTHEYVDQDPNPA